MMCFSKGVLAGEKAHRGKFPTICVTATVIHNCKAVKGCSLTPSPCSNRLDTHISIHMGL